MFLYIIVCIVIFGAGLFALLKPDYVWELRHYFSVRGGEPTDFYLFSTRLGGGCLMALAVFLLIVALS